MKKWLALTLVLALCLGLAVPALAVEEQAETVVIDDPELSVDYDYDYDWDYDWSYIWDAPAEEPTLTLMVNGVASAAEVTAEGGVSYVDAAALREALGETAVPADVTGPVAIRAAAEGAGWDVAWYSGWWGRGQEIQLWDKAAFETRLHDEFGPVNDFMGKVMEQSMGILFSAEAYAGHETADVKLKRFSTLDGDRDYTLTLAADYVVQNGVMDVTLTFDLSQLLGLIDSRDLAGLLGQGGVSVARLTQLLRAGKAELILDYNTGVLAYNIPLLALADESQAGWKAIDIDPYGALSDLQDMEDFSFVSTLYATMVTSAGYLGAGYAAENFEEAFGLLALFVGRDRFTTQNGKTTWSLTTRAVNEALGALVVEEGGWTAGDYSFFKAFDLSYSLDDRGNLSMDMHIRPDMAGITDAVADQEGYDDYGLATALGWLLPLLDMELTAGGSGSLSRSTSRLSVHWNNVGKLEMTEQATLAKTAKTPRPVAEVAPQVLDLGLVGGADGPTAILTTW